MQTAHRRDTDIKSATVHLTFKVILQHVTKILVYSCEALITRKPKGD